MTHSGSGQTNLPSSSNAASILLSRSSQARTGLSRSSHASSWNSLYSPAPGAPYMNAIPLPHATPRTVQAGLPPSRHAGHHIPSGSTALYANHSHPATLYVSPIVGMPAQLAWDVSAQPETASLQGARVSSQVGQNPATQPPMPDLTVCIMLRSEQKLHINASTPGGFVTVGEVLQRIYIFLQQPIPNAVVAGMSLRRRQSVDYAFQMRLSRIEPGSYEGEQRKGWKNVDILEGDTLWAGLSILGPREVKVHFTALPS